jgi:hypothetical protein
MNFVFTLHTFQTYLLLVDCILTYSHKASKTKQKQQKPTEEGKQMKKCILNKFINKAFIVMS